MAPKPSDPKTNTSAADDTQSSVAPAGDSQPPVAKDAKTATPPASPTAPGTKQVPSKAATASALKKVGIEILAEAKHAEDLICRVLSDGKRVWKEFFHVA